MSNTNDKDTFEVIGLDKLDSIYIAEGDDYDQSWLEYHWEAQEKWKRRVLDLISSMKDFGGFDEYKLVITNKRTHGTSYNPLPQLNFYYGDKLVKVFVPSDGIGELFSEHKTVFRKKAPKPCLYGERPNRKKDGDYEEYLITARFDRLFNYIGGCYTNVDRNVKKTGRKSEVINFITLPDQVNGSKCADVVVPRAATNDEIEAAVLALDAVNKALEGKAPKKIIIVPERIVNVIKS